MTDMPRKITIGEWRGRYDELQAAGLREPIYGGPLARHVVDGSKRLLKLQLDDSPAALRLWNFLLSEEDRLKLAISSDRKLVGAMKDLGTVPVMAFSFDNLTAFYPDGAWWLPCLLEDDPCLLDAADALGIDDSFCPVRAMLGAFVRGDRFPLPDLLICSVGATCDDFSAIAQRLESLGRSIMWWEIPHRRSPDAGERGILLPGGFEAPASQVAFVKKELERVRRSLEDYAGKKLSGEALAAGVLKANEVRRRLNRLRELVYTAEPCPLPALEMLIAEMLAIHFCSDQDESLAVLADLEEEALRRVNAGQGVLATGAARIFWVNPVADLRTMNIMEDVGGRVCGTDYMFCHALDPIPTDVDPMEALARVALADPMIGSPIDRARRICADVRRFGAQGVVISRIPGASHCALEGAIIGEIVRDELNIPVLEIESPSISDAFEPALRTRLEALIETVRKQP